MIKKNKIKIRLNGKYLLIDRNSNIKQLLIKLKIPLKKVAIELNKNILDKSKISKKILKDKDKMEIVHFIGGG